MDLTPEQQERYARHLLLDGWGGDGQERLLAAAVRVRGAGQGARWAARYLAASGVGELIVDADIADEVRAIDPDVRVVASSATDLGGRVPHPRGSLPDGSDIPADLTADVIPGPTALDGARAALAVCVQIAAGGSP